MSTNNLPKDISTNTYDEVENDVVIEVVAGNEKLREEEAAIRKKDAILLKSLPCWRPPTPPNDDITSSDHENSWGIISERLWNRISRKRHPLKTAARGYDESLLLYEDDQPQPRAAPTHTSFEPSDKDARIEDVVRDECSFFYKGFDDELPPPPDRFQKLHFTSTEEDDAYLPSGKITHSDVTRSSLFQERSAEGRVFMRLPVDNVRLLMDVHLESGMMLLVCDEAAEHRLPLLVTSHLHKTQTTEPEQQHNQVQPLNYVITVDQNLYQRVVKEISDRNRLPCGLYYCFHEADSSKVDIRIAIGILVLVFLFLFVVTLIWPYE